MKISSALERCGETGDDVSFKSSESSSARRFNLERPNNLREKARLLSYVVEADIDHNLVLLSSRRSKADHHESEHTIVHEKRSNGCLLDIYVYRS